MAGIIVEAAIAAIVDTLRTWDWNVNADSMLMFLNTMIILTITTANPDDIRAVAQLTGNQRGRIPRPASLSLIPARHHQAQPNVKMPNIALRPIYHTPRKSIRRLCPARLSPMPARQIQLLQDVLRSSIQQMNKLFHVKRCRAHHSHMPAPPLQLYPPQPGGRPSNTLRPRQTLLILVKTPETFECHLCQKFLRHPGTASHLALRNRRTTHTPRFIPDPPSRRQLPDISPLLHHRRHHAASLRRHRAASLSQNQNQSRPFPQAAWCSNDRQPRSRNFST